MPPSVPPRVDYALTPLGATLLDSVAALAERATLHRQEINDNRRRYDATHHAHNPDPPAQAARGMGQFLG
ncbi:winged helix-turn-helix transcriptional regulator [Streptomyces sp. enrichment culture]|uniref:winged helix-turn-helix transcriptional regulator n=1 Tax=Streptomyces sp. enrichment culture TaxID=1795815 RepID=UPI003F55EDC1